MVHVSLLGYGVVCGVLFVGVLGHGLGRSWIFVVFLRANSGGSAVLGDNRNNSHDSRFWFGGRGGGVPLNHVKARALFRWLGVTDAGVDWSRFGTPLAEPLLAPSMKSLDGDLERCLEQPREETVPPRTP